MAIEYVLFKTEDESGTKVNGIGSYAIVTTHERIRHIATREEPYFSYEGDYITIALLYTADITNSSDSDRKEAYRNGDSVSTIPSIRRFSGGIKHLPVDEAVLEEFERILIEQSKAGLSISLLEHH